jgi:beta-phosphoglucomutase-like phosphatase (HAD superfamily)
MLEAVIFDVDGTLVDSVEIHAEAWSEAFAHFGFDVPTRAVRPHIGKGGDHLLPVFLNAEQLESVGKKLDQFRSELFMTKYLERHKQIAGIADLIHEETSRDDAAKSKPDPDIFQAALRRLGQVNPARTRVIGDTPYDAMAARPLNAPCIGVLCGGWHERELREAGCVAVYRDPSELLARLDEWVR